MILLTMKTTNQPPYAKNTRPPSHCSPIGINATVPQYAPAVHHTPPSPFKALVPLSSLKKGETLATCPFLENCYLCRKKLQQGKDIYMYRGDRAFCSEECRRRQIFMDEESVRGDQCSVSAAAAAAERSRARRMAGKGEATFPGRSAC